MPVKTDVISGFLGAGKTTLITKLLKDVFAGKKVVLVENEFGEIGIDGGFLKEAGIVINEVNGGCICCTLQGDFQKALKQVVEQYHPDHIIIEPSGVGRLSDILSIVRSVDGLELNSYSTVVDAKRCATYHKNFKDFFDDQIATAACVILSRTQLTDDETLQKDLSIIRELNPDARVLTTPWDELNGNAIFEAMEGSSDGFPENIKAADDHSIEEHNHHHEPNEDELKANEGLSKGNRIRLNIDDDDDDEDEDSDIPDADDVFDSIGIETVNKYTEDDIRKALSGLGENIVRAKGIVPAKNSDEWLFFDYVPGSVDIRKGDPAYTGLITVIGTEVDVDQIKDLFQVK